MKSSFLLILTLLLLSCHKENIERPTYHYTPPPNTDPPLDLGALAKCNGYFMCTLVMGPDSTSAPTMATRACFSNEPVYLQGNSHGIPIKNVDLNGVTFKFNGNFYEDTTRSFFQQPMAWNINGEQLIPSFTQSISEPFPNFPTFYSLPDTLHQSQAYFLFLDKLILSEWTQLMVTDGPHAFGIGFGSKHDPYYCMTIAKLRQLNITDHAEIWMLATHRISFMISGRSFCFSFNKLYRKKIVIVA